MLTQATLTQIQNAPISERIRLIELLLESLKHDLDTEGNGHKLHTTFKLRTFDLGQDIEVDRDAIYSERVS